MLSTITGTVISYLLGSIPTAYIFCRVLKGVDIRKFGSGNVGATNAMRLLGKRLGLVVLFLDIVKGFLAVVLIGNMFFTSGSLISDEAYRIILGISCIIGHIWTVFLNFKGGKGIASTLGVLIGLAFKIQALKLVLGILILVWLSVFMIFRIVSIASVFSAACLPILVIVLRLSPFLIFSSLFLSLLVILRHKSNLKRFFEGKEPRLSFKKP